DRAGEQLVGIGCPARSMDGEQLTPGLDAFGDRRGRLGRTGRELVRARARDGDDQVEPVEQRPRKLVPERRKSLRRTGTLDAGVTTRPARTEIHRRDQLE